MVKLFTDLIFSLKLLLNMRIFPFFILLFTTFNFTLAYSQSTTGIVEYKASLNSDTFKNAIEKENNPSANKLLSEMAVVEDVIYLLNFDGNLSLFEKKPELENDGNYKMNITETLIGLGSYYFNTTTREVLFFSPVFENLLIKKTELEWELTEDFKIIMGYKCYKAKAKIINSKSKLVSNDYIIAWYSPELSLPFGPSKYAGLPGLILRLDSGEGITFEALKINFNLKKSFIINAPKGKVVTEKEAEEIAKKSFNKFKNGND